MDSNPERIYINLSSSADDTIVTATTDPDATFFEQRADPILANVANYRMCIVRAALQGNRNFPVLQASIQVGQPLPFLTTYKLDLQVTAGGTLQPVVPFPTFPSFITASSYNALGVLQQARTARVFLPSGGTIADVATQLQAAIRTGVVVDPLLSGIVVVPVGTRLAFSTTGIIAPVAGWSYSIQAWRPVDVTSFGFASMEIMTSDTSDVRSLELPYPCSYSLPLVPAVGGTFNGSATMVWRSQVDGIPEPMSPMVTVDTDSQAYWLYDYTWFAKLLNETIANAFNEITTAAAAANVPIDVQCPVVSYVQPRAAFAMRITKGATPSTNIGGAQLSVTLNKSLANLMVWPATYNKNGEATLLYDSAVSTPDGAYVDLLPDMPATGSGWSPVGSLVFLASGWQIRPEVMSLPNQVGRRTSNNASNATQQILSDVIPAFSDAADWNSYPILYSPQVPRWIDMIGVQTSLNNLDFACAWRNAVTGKIRIVTLNPGASFSVKILLQRKDVFP